MQHKTKLRVSRGKRALLSRGGLSDHTWLVRLFVFRSLIGEWHHFICRLFSVVFDEVVNVRYFLIARFNSLSLSYTRFLILGFDSHVSFDCNFDFGVGCHFDFNSSSVM